MVETERQVDVVKSDASITPQPHDRGSFIPDQQRTRRNPLNTVYLLDDTSVGQVRHTEVTVTTHKDRTGVKRYCTEESAGRGDIWATMYKGRHRNPGYFTRPTIT